MSRNMKVGIAAVIAAFVVSLLATEDAEARHRRFGRHRRGGGGCCGYVAPSCCGAAVAPACQTGACGVQTSACPGGVCGVAGGAYQGSYNAGYGSVQGQNYSTMPPAPGALNGQGAYNQTPTPAINGNSTFRQDNAAGQDNAARQNGAPGQDGAAGSPSDRPPAPNGQGNGSAPPAGNGSTSAPPPPPQDQ